MTRIMYFLSILILSAMLGGCASGPVIVSGNATASQLLPYNRNAEGFVNDVTTKVGTAANDEVTKEWLKAILESNAQSSVKLFDYPNNEDGRARMATRLTSKMFPAGLIEGGKFMMTHQSNMYRAKDDIKDVSIWLGNASDGATGTQPLTGTMRIGKMFSYYNASTRTTTAEEESYTASLDGSLAWLADGSLTANWKLTKGEYKSSIGRSSEFSLQGASSGLGLAITSARWQLDSEYDEMVSKVAESAKQKIKSRYTTREIKDDDQRALLKEVTFPVELKTAISRIQRLYGKWKFDPNSSTFSFENQGQNVNTANVWARSGLMISLFPEGNKTVVVFKVPHTLVSDTFTSKVLFGLNEASATFAADISAIEAKLSK